MEFPNGVVKKYAANVIAENILSQVDQSSFHSQSVKRIINHKRGVRELRHTMVGWKFHCEWKDGSSSWIPLKVLKESNPIEVAEYVPALELQDEPAFAWWVPYTLKKRDRVIACLLYTSPSPRDQRGSRMPSSA